MNKENVPKKYRLSEKIIEMNLQDEKAGLSGKPTASAFISHLINECNVTYSQVRRWINYTTDEESSIKTDHLIIISSYLNCSIDELINKQAFQNA